MRILNAAAVAIALLGSIQPSAAMRRPGDADPGYLCRAEYELALEARNRTLTDAEVSSFPHYSVAEIAYLEIAIGAVRSGHGPVQRPLSRQARIGDRHLATALNAILVRLLEAPIDSAWLIEFWTRYGESALHAHDIAHEGQGDPILVSLAKDAGHLDVEAMCTPACQYFRLLEGEPTALEAKVSYLLARAEVNGAASVRLVELGPQARAIAIQQLSGEWPTDPSADQRRQNLMMVLFKVLVSTGDARWQTLDLARLSPMRRDHLTYVSRRRHVPPGVLDLHATRAAFFLEHRPIYELPPPGAQ